MALPLHRGRDLVQTRQPIQDRSLREAAEEYRLGKPLVTLPPPMSVQRFATGVLVADQ